MTYDFYERAAQLIRGFGRAWKGEEVQQAESALRAAYAAGMREAADVSFGLTPQMRRLFQERAETAEARVAELEESLKYLGPRAMQLAGWARRWKAAAKEHRGNLSYWGEEWESAAGERDELRRFLDESLKPHDEACEVKRWANKLVFGPDPECSCGTVASLRAALERVREYVDASKMPMNQTCMDYVIQTADAALSAPAKEAQCECGTPSPGLHDVACPKAAPIPIEPHREPIEKRGLSVLLGAMPDLPDLCPTCQEATCECAPAKTEEPKPKFPRPNNHESDCDCMSCRPWTT